MISFEKAISILDAQVGPLDLPAGPVPLAEAMGRVAVGPYASRVDLPPFDKSAMDGFAVRAEDDRPGELEVLEVVRAGQVPTVPLRAGAASKVMTGAAVPEGTAKVVMVEQTEQRGGRVRIVETDERTNFCRRGEDVRAGQVVLRGPRRIGTAEIANLVSCGVLEVRAARRIRAAILATGDEIVDDPARLGAGKIMNANGPMLAALCRAHGLEVACVERVADDAAQTRSAIEAALAAADVLIVTGGVSVGDFDFVGPALAEAGLTVHYDSVAIKPGRPMTLATRGAKVALGLPGNPVSVYLTFHLFVRRAARRLAGLDADLRVASMTLARGYRRRRTERAAYVPCRLNAGGMLEPVEYHGSAHLYALLEADGVFRMERGCGEAAAGQDVPFLRLTGLYG